MQIGFDFILSKCQFLAAAQKKNSRHNNCPCNDNGGSAFFIFLYNSREAEQKMEKGQQTVSIKSIDFNSFCNELKSGRFNITCRLADDKIAGRSSSQIANMVTDPFGWLTMIAVSFSVYQMMLPKLFVPNGVRVEPMPPFRHQSKLAVLNFPFHILNSYFKIGLIGY